MKKLLALVLALVMVMGLATVGANAASVKYADADSITYKEAVDVLSEIGILGGDAAGFRPTDTLKRSEGAKIVTYLLLGNKAADALQGSGTRFTDLPANHWAAGYMEYLAAVGVMGGMGDGTIAPDGSLTAVQFAKMLLTALGYDAEVENLGGPDWAINTQRLATSVDLFDGNSSVSPNAAVTREEAALYALNTLKTPLVEYSNKGSSIAVNGTTINLGASKAEYVTGTIAKEQTISDTKLTNSNLYTIEFAERYYKDLTQIESARDAFMRPATTWKLKNATIGTYADAPDLTFTKSIYTGEIYAGLGLTDGIAADNIKWYEDGADKSDKWTWPIVKGDVLAAHKPGGNGTLTEVYYDNSNDTVEIIEINTYVAKVTAVVSASTTKDAYVTLGGGASLKTGDGNTYETDEFKKDDIVYYTYSYKAGENCVESMGKTTLVEGNLDRYTDSKSITIDGTLYEQGFAAQDITGIDTAITKTAKVYLDDNGYALYVDASTSAKYAVVLGYEKGNTMDNARIKLLFEDGTVKTVALDSAIAEAGIEGSGSDFVVNDEDAGMISLYDIVSYKVNSDGEYYDIAVAADSVAPTPGTTKITRGTTAIVNTGKAYNQIGTNGNVYADGKTKFIVMDTTGTATTYTVYTGIGNVPTIDFTKDDTGEHVNGDYVAHGYSKNVAIADDPEDVNVSRVAVYKKPADNYIKYVFVLRNHTDITMSNGNQDVIWVKGSGDNETYVAKGNYYEYTAYKDGEQFTLKSGERFTAYSIIVGPSYNEKEVLTGEQASVKIPFQPDNSVPVVATISGADVGGGQGVGALSNGVANLGGTNLAIDANAKVHYFAVDGTIRQTNRESLIEDANDIVWYVTDENIVKTIYVYTVDVPDDGVNASSYKFNAGDFAVAAGTTLGTVKFTNTTGTVIKGETPAAKDGLTVTAQAYARDVNQNWVLVSTASKDTSLDENGVLTPTDDINVALDAGSYRITLTLTGADIGSLSLGSYVVNIGAGA